MRNRPRHADPSPQPASRATPLPQGERGKYICVGQFGAPLGVRGEVRLRSFTSEPSAIGSYAPLETEDGRIIAIEALRPFKDHFVATLAGIRDRDAAARLTNAKLYVPRERLPTLAALDEFYHADLVGLAAVDPAGKPLGTVVAIHNFGAGDLIEIRADEGGSELLPFDAMTVPEIDVAHGRLVVHRPYTEKQSPPPLRGRPAAKRSGGG